MATRLRRTLVLLSGKSAVTNPKLKNAIRLTSRLLTFLTSTHPLPLRKLERARMVYLTRLEHFNAAHKLYNPNWSAEQNEEVFGACANENWHGHNFDLYVTVKGMPHPETGFVMDVKQLKMLIKEQVIKKVDHKNLNLDVDFLQGKMCSTENLAMGIWNQLAPHIPSNVQLHCIKLYETPRIYVEYFGE